MRKLLMAALAASLMGIATPVWARSIAVTAQSATSVTLAFGAEDRDDYELFLASGVTDGEDDKYAWDGFTRMAAIPGDQDTYTCEVPEALRDGRFLRFFLLQRQNVACVKELAWVKSSGAQYVDTGLIPTTRMVVDFRFGDVTYVNSTAFFGQGWTNSRYLFNQQSNTFYFHGSSTKFNIAPTGNTDYHCMVDDENTFYLTWGGQTKRITGLSRSVDANAHFAIFGCISGDHLATFRFYRMKIAVVDPTANLRDLVPAMNAEGEAGLYDHLNNAFYKSKTATPLQAGPERPAERFGRVADSTLSLTFRRSMAIDAFTETGVKLAFGNPRNQTYKLFLASGATDGGDDKTAWDSFSELTTIAPDQTSYEVVFPSRTAPAPYYRFFLLQTTDLPYSTELVSMTSTGTQFVPLDFIPTAQTTADFRFGNITYANSTAFFGQAWNGYGYLLNQQSNKFMFHSTGVNLDTAVAANTTYRCRITDTNYLLLEHNGAQHPYPIDRRTSLICPLAVFNTWSLAHGATFRFDSLRLWENGFLARDLVPVGANGKGALFDRVNGRLYFNENTGADFTRGAVVTRAGWVVAQTATQSTAAPAASGEITLTADTDWSSEPTRLTSQLKVNLNGFKLTLATAEDRDDLPEFEGNGTVEFNVAAGKTWLIPWRQGQPVFSAGVNLVKNGAGTLVLERQMKTVAHILVNAGTVKMAGYAVLKNGTPLVVKNGGTFDFCGCAENCVDCTIEGFGPDGKGALRNTATCMGLLNCSTTVGHLAGLTLSGDAGVYTVADHMGLMNSNSAASKFELNGHTLTIDYATGAGFWFMNVSSATVGKVFVKRGIPYFYHNTYEVSLPNVDFIIDGPNSIFRIPTSGYAKKTTVHSVTLQNGGKYEEGNNNGYMQTLSVLNGGEVGGSDHVKWIYIADAVLVSNETGTVAFYPPMTANSTYPRLVKQGAGTLNLEINHTDQRIDRGLDLQGGTVVMNSRASTKNYHYAISSQPAPVKIHAGATLDMRLCAQPLRLATLEIEPGGTLLHSSAHALTFPNGTIFRKPRPFEFEGKVEFAGTVTFDLGDLFQGANPPAPGSTLRLFEVGTAITSTTAEFALANCPYEYFFTFGDRTIDVTFRNPTVMRPNPIKIWTVGGNYVLSKFTENGQQVSFRLDLAQRLEAAGWNVQMTGWRTVNPRLANAFGPGNASWKGHMGVLDLALKTSATRAGLLEGLEAYCAAANEPDFTILVCGDTDVADGVADAKVLSYLQEAVNRIKTALPMTTVIVSTIPGASASLNNQITSWCASQTEVESVDLAPVLGAAPTRAEFELAAGRLKDLLTTLATPTGKNTPSTWTRPAVNSGAVNNVPANYLAGFTHVRTMEPGEKVHYAQNLEAIPYSYAPAMQADNIAKVGYYLELVRKDTGALQAVWVDMDAPGTTWADVAFPVTVAQQKQKPVTKLHVWSNSGAVTPVPPNDDSVEGYIEFNCINYSGGEVAAGTIAEPKAGGYGFNDTFNTSGSSGHGCFQVMRKFADASMFPAGEVLLMVNRWGSTSDYSYAIGIGTLANMGNHGWTTSVDFDRTFCYGDPGTDYANISSPAYAVRKLEFWLKYTNGQQIRESAVDGTWANGMSREFASPGNWSTVGGTLETLAGKSLRLANGQSAVFTYSNVDPMDLARSPFILDGSATFSDLGGLSLASLDMGQTGRLVIDPVKFSLRLATAPVFAAGAKIALTSNYAAYTKGRFLLMTWDAGVFKPDDTALAALFDTASTRGANVKLTVENLKQGGRLWLDLNAANPGPRLNILSMGDSITQGDDATYGNWRTLLMKKAAAEGFTPVGKGYWTIQSGDICQAPMPEEWIHHAGISGQRLVGRLGGGAGTIDAVAPTLDQAGDVDFVIVKLGTNDINSDNASGASLFAPWTNLVWQVLRQKPHAKFIAAAVVDIAYDATKNAQVVAFNNLMRKAIEEDRIFPERRVYFADLYTACYRYDSSNTYIPGSFYAADNLHPDWPGEMKMAETFFNTMRTAMADQDAESSWQPGAADLSVPTTTGAEANVPSAYLAGLRRARVLDLAAHSGEQIHSLFEVPYEPYAASTAPVANLSRVGYYIELKRRNDAQNDFHGLVRWLWVSMDAFGGRTIEDVGVPRNRFNQRLVRRLRVKTNMPNIAETAADAGDVSGWVEFWPSSYSDGASGAPGAPANFWGYDWNDVPGTSLSGFGTMQVFRLTPGAAHPAETIFSFGHWTTAGGWEIGLGNFANQVLGSIDWTFSGSDDKNMRATMSADAYEVARLEIWTASMLDDADAPSATVTVDNAALVNGTMTVEGTVADFGTGASSATVRLEWSTDPAFGSTMGSRDLGTFTATGAVTTEIEGLDPTKTWYFRYVSTNDRGASGHSTSVNGNPPAAPVAFWRARTAADTWSSTVWQPNGETTLKAFEPAWEACFDGQDSARTGRVAVPSPVTADRVTVSAASNYTFEGPGTITARELVKTGSGTLTLEGGVLAGTRDIDVRAGVVKLGDTAVPGAAGLDGGTITVRNGAQFDLNYNDGTGGVGRPRARITGEKKFVIEGAGPDGNGALTSTFTGSSSWGSVLGQVFMTGDATIGGTSRFDLRDTSVYGLTGPRDATLTIKNSEPSVGLNLHGTTSVGKIVIDPVGRFTLESSSFALDVPNGIDLYGNLMLWGSGSGQRWDVGGLRAKGANARISNGSTSTGYVKTGVTVESDATLTLASNPARFLQTVTNMGTIVSASGSQYFDSDLFNIGNPLISLNGGAFYLYAPHVYGDSRVVINSSWMWLTGKQDFGTSALDVTLNGGSSLVIGTNNDGSGLPRFAPGKLVIHAASGHSGVVYYHNATSASIYGPLCTGVVNDFRSQGPTSGGIVDIQATNLVVNANIFQIGTSSGYGELTVGGPETDITATTLIADNVNNNAHRGMFTFAEGLLTIGSGGITTAWRQPMRPLFVMANGTLKAGADFAINKPGMTAVFGSPKKGGKVTVDLNGHNVKWSTGLAGASDVTIKGTGVFGPERPGIQGIPTGKWTIDTTSPVDLRNAAGFAGGLELAENARATIDIAGTNLVELVFWNWYSDAWKQMRPRAYGTQQLFTPHLATSLTFVNRAPTTLTDSKSGSGTGFNYTGQFYVSAERVGTWRFAHNCKTHSGIIVDGVELSTPGPNTGKIVSVDLAEGWHDFMLSFYNGGSGAIGPNSGDGVHSFWFKVGGNGDGSWPADYTPFDVDNVPMRMRPGVNAKTSVRWRRYLSYGNSVNEYLTADESKYTTLDMVTNSLQVIHTKFSTGKNAPLGGSSTRFDGYFYVAPERAGTWFFQGGFDDNVSIVVDGTRLFATAGCAKGYGSATLTEGWHAFKLLLGDNTASDNTSSGTGGLCTDSHGNVATIMFSANGGPDEAFDERYVPIALQPGDAQKYEQAGLGGETKLAAGSTLVNDTVLRDAFCPIYGVLSGAGLLDGPFRFTGEKNGWSVAGAANRRVMAEATSFENADEQMFAGLKGVKATFDRKPVLPVYELANSAYGLTSEAMDNVALEVKDADGNDYSENFRLAFRNNKLVLVNSHPGGLHLFIR